MKLKIKNKPCGLVPFYDDVAREMGYENPDNLHYDCTKINIAPNIQEDFFAYFREMNPDVPANEINASVAMVLVCSGPKVDDSLKANEVEVFDDFVTIQN